jgi:hypothetical protein
MGPPCARAGVADVIVRIAAAAQADVRNLLLNIVVLLVDALRCNRLAGTEERGARDPFFRAVFDSDNPERCSENANGHRAIG